MTSAIPSTAWRIHFRHIECLSAVAAAETAPNLMQVDDNETVTAPTAYQAAIRFALSLLRFGLHEPRIVSITPTPIAQEPHVFQEFDDEF